MLFDKLKEAGLFTSFSTQQVESIEAIIAECVKQGVIDQRQVAYILATAYHECHNPRQPALRLTPMIEYGGEAYLRKKPYFPFYGRGFSQLTWDYNYLKEKRRTGVDLLGQPNKMLEIPLAANSHVYCMKNGIYTGKKLSDYINGDKCDLINARRIVNGTDRAELVMGYAAKFLDALK